MLKFVKDKDLAILAKYGFKKTKLGYEFKNIFGEENDECIDIYEKDRLVVINGYNIWDVTPDVLFDLIKDDLIEKVTE